MDGNFDVFSVLMIVDDDDDDADARGGTKSEIADSGIKFNFNKPPTSELSFRRVLFAVPIVYNSGGNKGKVHKYKIDNMH